MQQPHHSIAVLLSLAERGDRVSAWALVDEVGRQGEGYAFVRALAATCGLTDPHDITIQEWAWDLLCAKPEQIAIAARVVFDYLPG